ncbi:hypothetical protein [Lewinella sp. W8]|uniref:hypothetical protein n=1 Tax=Lewinella sp. W8 TaxID=2528208 RepID=UPI0010672F04|nr:hypothetical protein [Lewinella sp. W8]MTB52395.1 hypothetical protein [Lewinella sp. W8]
MNLKIERGDIYRALVIGLLYALLRTGMTYWREEAATMDLVSFLGHLLIGAVISLVLGILFPKMK